jgi:hypothetical protein
MRWSACLAVVLLPLSAGATAARTAYEVTLDATWSAVSHPVEYPPDAHFSWLIGVTHADGYTLFGEGEIATPGLEALAEQGELTPFDAEIAAAMRTGRAGMLFTGSPVERMPGRTVFEVEVDEAHPRVSFATMIAPSTDWFTGVVDVRLLQDGEWVAEIVLPLLAWDAGTDSGATFTAVDVDTLPRERVAPLTSPPFAANGQDIPLGTATFRRR